MWVTQQGLTAGKWQTEIQIQAVWVQGPLFIKSHRNERTNWTSIYIYKEPGSIRSKAL